MLATVQQTPCASNYLAALECEATASQPADYYLWPRTPLGDIQGRTLQRVGASDFDVRVPYSRPALILKLLNTLRSQGRIPPDFSVLDIACGDGLILWQIKRRFPAACCFGVDCSKGQIDTHPFVERAGVALYNVFIQHLFRRDGPGRFDVAMMLNSYRGWESADLREHERCLPDLADAWLKQNARYVVVTATEHQLDRLRSFGFGITLMGKGEDDSIMVCLACESTGEAPAPLQEAVPGGAAT